MNRSKLFAISLSLLAFLVGWDIGNQNTTALERADLPLDVAYTGGFQTPRTTIQRTNCDGQSRQHSARGGYG